MMNSIPVPIHTYSDLQKEKDRLQNLLKNQRQLLKESIQSIQDELKPASAILRVVGYFTSRNRKSKTLNTLLDYGGKFLLKRGLKKITWPLKLIILAMIKNFSSNTITNSKNSIIKKIIRMLP